MRNEIWFGIMAAIGLVLFYASTLYLLNGPSHVFEEFSQNGILIILMAIGFGTNIGLFFFMRNELKNRAGTKALAATSGTSAGTMVACCLHHAADLLPLVGLSGFFLFAPEATTFFLSVGVISSALGIVFSLAILQKHDLIWSPALNKIDWSGARYGFISIAAIAIVGIAGATWLLPVHPLTNPSGTALLSNSALQGLSPLTDTQNNVQVDVTPRMGASSTSFEIRFTTHSGSMDFAVDQIARLQDDLGREYKPLQWNGSPPGGHHRSGTLVFAPMPAEVSSIQLTLSKIGNADRVFKWKLK